MLRWAGGWASTEPRFPSLLQGFVPAAIRLVPHTVLTFVFLEQLRKYFGIKVLA